MSRQKIRAKSSIRIYEYDHFFLLSRVRVLDSKNFTKLGYSSNSIIYHKIKISYWSVSFD
jgi:hypothetical protein